MGMSGGFDKTSSWNAIGQLGFYFLGSLESVDLHLDVLSEPDPNSIVPVLHQVVIGDNRGNSRDLILGLDNADSKTVSTSATTEESWTEELGVEVSVSGGFFGIGEFSAGTSASYGYTETQSNTTSHASSTTLSWSGSTSVRPGGYTVGELYFYTGQYTVKYSASIVLKSRSGETHTIIRDGEMKGTAAGVAM